MAKVTAHTPGMFSWADLCTSDPAAAKKFYTALFGWQYEDDEDGPDAAYFVAKLGDERAAALYKQGRDEKRAGIPSHWNCYFTVANIAAVSKTIKRAGGQVLCPPFDVPDSGRMCIFAEPEEAVCALWQPGEHIGATVMGEHGAIAWAELMSRDPDSSIGFLIEVFGWQAEAMAMPNGDYTAFKVDGKPSAGLLEMPESLPEALPSMWVPYFSADDCDQVIAAALKGGGKLIGVPVTVPNVGRFAMLADPQGAFFSVITAAAPAAAQ